MFKNCVIGAISKDGLMYQFDIKDGLEILKNYEKGKNSEYENVWYFNKMHDRECAEKSGNIIFINPSIVIGTIGFHELQE